MNQHKLSVLSVQSLDFFDLDLSSKAPAHPLWELLTITQIQIYSHQGAIKAERPIERGEQERGEERVNFIRNSNINKTPRPPAPPSPSCPLWSVMFIDIAAALSYIILIDIMIQIACMQWTEKAWNPDFIFELVLSKISHSIKSQTQHVSKHDTWQSVMTTQTRDANKGQLTPAGSIIIQILMRISKGKIFDKEYLLCFCCLNVWVWAILR